MEQETIAQTMLDQLVTDENSQMLKALIPYLSFSGQRILAAYAKTQELCNTLQLFSRPQNDMQICSSRPVSYTHLTIDSCMCKFIRYSIGNRKWYIIISWGGNHQYLLGPRIDCKDDIYITAT